MIDPTFAVAGELAATYAGVDWGRTAVGAPETWSPTLVAVFETMCRTKFPCTLFWGPEAVLLHNAEYVPILGEKHPGALGRPTSEVFPEAWPYIDGLLQRVRSTGEAVYERDALVPLRRGGQVRDAFFTFCYSAVCDAEGTVEGVLDIVSETTDQVLAARRLALVDEVREAVADKDEPSAVHAAALGVLQAAGGDLVAAELTEDLLGTTAQPAPQAGDRASMVPGRDVVVDEPPGGPRTVALRLRTETGTGRDARLDLVLSETVTVDEALLGTIRTLGSTITNASGRSALRAAEREVARIERGFSEALQRNLLGRPAPVAGVEIEVRYAAATDVVRVGGDWYDSFLLPDGSLVLAVGDIAGHDGYAAVAMSQARSVLRGIAFSSPESPSQMMTSLDQAFTALQIAPTATAVVARMEAVDSSTPAGPRTVRWCSAGHLPPALVDAAGEVSLLEPDPEPLLGLTPGGPRHDHATELAPGATLVLYTDGLVERRGEHLDVGLARLRDALHGSHGRAPGQVVDDLLAMVGPTHDDDIAIMLARSAGPSS